MPPWVRFSLALLSCGLAVLIAWSLAAGNGSPTRPNILFILTDDQDVHMDSLFYMPYLQKHLVSEGLTFRKHFCTVALCCPARGVLWSGQSAHNTNVTELAPPYGGYPKWVDQGYNERHVPIWLQAAGYDTYYVGKFLNSLSVNNYDKPYPAGWTGSDFLLDPYTYCYDDSVFQRNHEPPVTHTGQYSGDVVTKKAHGFLDDALANLKDGGAPFFLTVAPVAPHGTVCPLEKDGKLDKDAVYRGPPIPAERHKHLFNDAIVPRTPNFNPEQSSGAQWIATLPRQNQTNVDYNDEYFRDRLRSLQSVDEMIGSLIQRLEDAGVLDNTWIFYSTDNGFHVGQHRMQPGKQSPYEEDLNIPMIVRGPGVPKGNSSDLITSHADFAPTFLEIAGASVPEDFILDGQAMPLQTSRLLVSSENNDEGTQWGARDLRQEQVNVEHWGIHIPEGKYGMIEYSQNTYKAMRLVSEGFNIQYTVWCTGEHELYNLDVDPYEMNNLALRQPSTEWRDGSNAYTEGDNSDHQKPLGSNAQTGNSATVGQMLQRVDAMLLLLKDCKGRQCTHPWQSYFPAGEVSSLAQALDPRYDAFFAKAVASVDMEECTKGYIPELEGPAWNASQIFAMTDEVWLGRET